MENFRSKSCKDGRNQIQGGQNYDYGDHKAPSPKGMQGLRSYSVNSYYTHQSKEVNKTYNCNIITNGSIGNDIYKERGNIGSSSRVWRFKNPELQRKKRVVGYKVYTMEGKMKGSMKKSFKWIKDTCNQVVHGWR